MIGIPYVARIPPFARALSADDVLCRISAPSTGVLLVVWARFGARTGSALNENTAAAFVRLSSDGSGGATMTFEEVIESAAAFPGSGATMDADGWTQPTVSGNPFNDFSGNLASGLEWAPLTDDDYIVVPPSARIGLRLLTAPSASQTYVGAIGLRYLGS